MMMMIRDGNRDSLSAGWSWKRSIGSGPLRSGTIVLWWLEWNSCPIVSFILGNRDSVFTGSSSSR